MGYERARDERRATRNGASSNAITYGQADKRDTGRHACRNAETETHGTARHARAIRRMRRMNGIQDRNACRYARRDENDTHGRDARRDGERQAGRNGAPYESHIASYGKQ